MAAVERLMGVGENWEIAKRTGFFIAPTVVTFGLNTFKGPGNVVVRVASASASIVLDDSFDIGDIAIIIANGVAVSLYPGSTSFINPTSVGAVHAVSADVTRIFLRQSQSAWFAISSV